MISNQLVTLEKFLDLHSSKYEKVLMLGDFYEGVNEKKNGLFLKLII